jgi:hypothetical protein
MRARAASSALEAVAAVLGRSLVRVVMAGSWLGG